MVNLHYCFQGFTLLPQNTVEIQSRAVAYQCLAEVRCRSIVPMDYDNSTS